MVSKLVLVSDSSNTALVSKSNFISKYCKYCKLKGYTINECRQRKQNSNRKNNISYNNRNNSNETELAFATLHQPIPKDEWILDSGATSHFAHDKNDIIANTFRKITSQITTVSGHQTSIKGIGNIRIFIKNNSQVIPIVIESVQYAPQLSSKLISESVLTSKGFTVYKSNQDCKISKGNTIIRLSKCSNNLYTFEQALTLSNSLN